MNNEAVRRDFNLSRNVSLRTLETTATSIANAGDSASGFLKAVLSTITSPLPLNFVITYRYFDVDLYVSSWDRRFRVRGMAQNVLDHPRRFEVFSEIHKCEGFDWCSVRMFSIALQSALHEHCSAFRRRKG